LPCNPGISHVKTSIFFFFLIMKKCLYYIAQYNLSFFAVLKIGMPVTDPCFMLICLQFIKNFL
jgi:hypothetical protein